MMELTGEIGDGVVLNYLVSPEYNERAMEQLAVGAARADRTVDDLDRPQLVVSARLRPVTTRPIVRSPSTAPGCWSRSTWANSRTS